MLPSAESVSFRIARAKTHLSLDEPFFGNLIYRLKFVEDYSADTAWTDSVHLGYNPNYVETISDEELKGLLCHEILHVAMGHCWRRKWREPKKWNEAGDYAINLIVIRSGYRLPPGGLVDNKYEGMCAEVIYDTLPDTPQGAPQKSPQSAKSKDKSSETGDGSEGSSSDSSEGGDAEGKGAENSKDQNGDKSSAKDSSEGNSKSEDGSSQSSGSEGTPSDGSSKDTDTDEGANSGSAPKDSKQSKGSKKGSKDKKSQGPEGKGDNSPNTPDAGPEREMETSDKPFGQYTPGEVRDAPASADQSALEAEWKIAVQEALACATRRGKVPGGIKEMVAEALKPRVDWRAVLRQFIQQAWSAVDYTWKMPAANYLPYGLYLPRLASESLPCMVIAIDTSASVSSRLLAQFKAEVRFIVEELCPDECYLMYCDAIVHLVLRFVAHEPLKFPKTPGRGGTSFIPVFAEIEAQQISPVCLVYLTDMDGVAPAKPPNYPVLWVSPPTRIAAPWGEHVQMFD